MIIVCNRQYDLYTKVQNRKELVVNEKAFLGWFAKLHLVERCPMESVEINHCIAT